MSANDPKRTLGSSLTEPRLTRYDALNALGSDMRRREFLATLSGALAAWPLTARAQQPERMRRIGVLLPAAADDTEFQAWVGAFLLRDHWLSLRGRSFASVRRLWLRSQRRLIAPLRRKFMNESSFDRYRYAAALETNQ